MAPASTFSAPLSTPDTSSRTKFRVRFRKAGDLRFLSHHDLMHLFERMFRRAELPILSTQGFNPRPRMWFALSLALGVAGLREILEFEIGQPIPADEVMRRLVRQSPLELEIQSVRVIDFRASAQVRRAWYRLALENEPALAPRCQAFLQSAEHWVERIRPRHRRINVRPYVDELGVLDNHLTMALWITPSGAARPEEIITALGLQGLLDAGAVIERSDLEIYDELAPGVSGPPLWEAAPEELSANDGASSEPLVAARPTAIMDSPFSFDS